MRELVVRSDDSTITSVWRFRNATSSMNVDEAQPDSASAAIARAIRRLMDVAYRIRPLAGRIPSPRRGGRKESRGRPGCGGSRGPADAPRGREVADELPGGHHQDRLLRPRRVELLAERDLQLEFMVHIRLD